MKYRIMLCALCCAVAFGFPFMSQAADRDVVDWVVGIGVVVSPDYNNDLKDAYPRHSVDGGFGWLDFKVGVRFNAVKNVSFTPAVDLFMNFGIGDVSFVNTIVLPSLSARWSLKETPSFYLEGEVNYGIPNMGADFDAKSGGVGFGGYAGYEFKWGIAVEGGYLHVPVKVSMDTRSRYRDEDSRNFGGFLIRAKYAF